MKLILMTLLIAISTITAKAQLSNCKILSKKEVKEIFNDEVRNYNNIAYPIFRVYSYSDSKGKYYLALTESIDNTAANDTVSKNIKAILFKAADEVVRIVEINDNILDNANTEYTISFFTKYMSFEKLGTTIIPIIIYGTKATNEYMDGRFKIVVIYNDQKIVICHQNAVLDGERLTKIDKAFYTLPAPIQKAVQKKIAAMEKADQAILGNNWEIEMKRKKLEIKG
jgi:hypothetical protein